MNIIDHISLELDLNRAHITFDNKKITGTKLPKLKTLKVKEDMILWFVIGVKECSMLEKAPLVQEIQLKIDESEDYKRRMELIMKSRENCIFNVTKINDEFNDISYLNFEFFVSLDPSKENLPPSNVYHIGLSSYNIEKDFRTGIPTRLHHVILKEFTGCIWIRVSKIKGTVKNNHAIFVYPDFPN